MSRIDEDTGFILVSTSKPLFEFCRVYWGSHGCIFRRGHVQPHECDCCECENHELNPYDEDGVLCVGKPPYYGSDTKFYGEDV